MSVAATPVALPQAASAAPALPTKASKLPWTAEEDAKLRLLVEATTEINPKEWRKIAAHFTSPSRTATQLVKRWQKVLNPQPEPKGPWTPEEDKRLADLVALHGACRWSMLATEFEGRDGKQVRERWHSYLDPEIKRAPWSAEENAMIISLKLKLGSKWAEIAGAVPGRTEEAVKNHWNSALRLQVDKEKRAKTEARKQALAKAKEESAGKPPRAPKASSKRAKPTGASPAHAAAAAKRLTSPLREEEDDDDDDDDDEDDEDGEDDDAGATPSAVSAAPDTPPSARSGKAVPTSPLVFDDFAAQFWLSPVPMPVFSPGTLLGTLASPAAAASAAAAATPHVDESPQRRRGDQGRARKALDMDSTPRSARTTRSGR